MADSWIKMRVTLLTCPQVVRIASALDADGLRGPLVRTLVVGLLHATWSLADTHTEDGALVGYTPEVLDALVGVDGWTAALASVGWAVVTADGITIPEFSEHNGASAKRRAKEQRRKADVRDLSAKRPTSVRTQCGQDADQSESESESENSTTPPKAPPGGGSADKPRRGGGKVRISLHDVERLAAAACVPDEALPAVRDWWGYRRDSGKPLVRASWERLLSEAAKDPPLFVASVEHSIRQGSQGLFPPNGSPRKSPKPVTPTRESKNYEEDPDAWQNIARPAARRAE